MRLYGIQKLTLLDFPGHLACTLFTGGCNLRCPFCHNASLVLRPEDQLDNDDVLDFLLERRGRLQGICLTGGEPLIQSGVAEFLSEVREIGYRIKLDSNGCFPEKLRSLVEAGLVDYVAMDVKNCPERYPETVGVPGLDLGPVRESIAFLLEGTVDYEFRTTVVRELHDEESLLSLARWIKGTKRYFLQAFTDSGDLITDKCSGYKPEELRELLAAVQTIIPQTELRGV